MNNILTVQKTLIICELVMHEFDHGVMVHSHFSVLFHYLFLDYYFIIIMVQYI